MTGLWSVLAVVACVSCARAAGSAQGGYRWLYYSRSCTTEEQLAKGREFVDRAAEAGMNGMLVGNIDDLWRQGKRAQDCVRRLGEYGALKGVTIIPHGWAVGSGTMTSIYPDMKESVLAKGMPYEVRGRSLVPSKSATSIRNPDLAAYDLANNAFDGWWSDRRGVLSFVDVDGGHEGRPAIRFEPSPERNPDRHSRVCQKIELTPNRRYRFSAWVRGEGLQRHFHPIRIVAIVETEKGKTREAASRGLPVPGDDHDWHRLTIEFATGGTGLVYLYAGSWNATEGKVWVSDFALEEIGITELSRRTSAPRRLRNAVTGTVYREGKDWTLAETSRDEEVRFDLPEGSLIRPGDRLLLDCFVVSHGGPKFKISTCMSDPRLYECFEKSARCVEEVLHPRAWLLAVDEVMNGGTCERCKARKTDMAHIFGDSITRMREIIRRASPKAEVFAWSDMFDPHHNARANVASCASTFAGVADLIPKDVGLMLWYGEKLDLSAPYFTSRGHALMGSICCDGRNCEKAVRLWKEKLTGYPELKGFMYTTWLNDYTKLKTFTEILK